jgi:hypothetical protein
VERAAGIVQIVTLAFTSVMDQVRGADDRSQEWTEERTAHFRERVAELVWGLFERLPLDLLDRVRQLPEAEFSPLGNAMSAAFAVHLVAHTHKDNGEEISPIEMVAWMLASPEAVQAEVREHAEYFGGFAHHAAGKVYEARLSADFEPVDPVLGNIAGAALRTAAVKVAGAFGIDLEAAANAARDEDNEDDGDDGDDDEKVLSFADHKKRRRTIH